MFLFVCKYNQFLQAEFQLVIGGIAGIGGGMVLVPVWLTFGIDRFVTTSTSPPVILFTTMIQIVLYFLMDAYDGYYYRIPLYIFVGFLGSMVIKSTNIIKIRVARYYYIKIPNQISDLNYSILHLCGYFWNVDSPVNKQIRQKSLDFFSNWKVLLNSQCI